MSMATPERVRREGYCPARLPKGIPKPYYEDMRWDGKLKPASMAYRPSGRFSWRSVLSFLVLAPALGTVATVLAYHVIRLIGFSFLLMDVGLPAIALVLAARPLYSGCR